MWIHNECTLTFDLHGPILCVSEDFLSQLLCIHNVDMGSFDLHGLILYVSEGDLSELLCIYNEGMGSFDLHGLILYVSEGLTSVLLQIDIVDTEFFYPFGLIYMFLAFGFYPFSIMEERMSCI